MKKIFGFIIAALLCLAMLNGCAKPDIEKLPPEEMPEKAVMIDNVLYYYTGQHIELLRCGVMDGKITEFVPTTQLPTENDQSNFGDGYEYQFAGQHHIDIVMPEENNAWIRFCDRQCSEDHSQTLTEELYSQQVGEFVPDYDTEYYDGISDTFNPGGLCEVAHNDGCPTGACITVDGAICVRTDGTVCICGYPLKENIVPVVGSILTAE
ncbi:MAG: hypothetical protein IKY30_02240 [Oscillospiraceae bacterium]|nr:hypothetical protein [Oscillospiraceae bacterium]